MAMSLAEKVCLTESDHCQLQAGSIIEFVAPPLGLLANQPYLLYEKDGVFFVLDGGGMRRYFSEWSKRSKFTVR